MPLFGIDDASVNTPPAITGAAKSRGRIVRNARGEYSWTHQTQDASTSMINQ